jgi:hypothetical protein
MNEALCNVEAGLEDAAGLSARFGQKTAGLGVVGLGCVGLPLALVFSRNGLSINRWVNMDP